MDRDALAEAHGPEAVRLYHTSAEFAEYLLARCISALGWAPQAVRVLDSSLGRSLRLQADGQLLDLGGCGLTCHLADALQTALEVAAAGLAEEDGEGLGLGFVAEARLRVWKARFAAREAEQHETAVAACELRAAVLAAPDTFEVVLGFEDLVFLNGLMDTLGAELQPRGEFGLISEVDGGDSSCSRFPASKVGGDTPVIVGIDDSLSRHHERALAEGLEAHLNTTAWTNIVYSQVLYGKKQYDEAARIASDAMVWFAVSVLGGRLKCSELGEVAEKLGPEALPYIYSSTLVSIGISLRCIIARGRHLDAKALHDSAELLIALLTDMTFPAELWRPKR